ncbi:MAG: cytochrome c3 family protein [Chthoniobacteraceae bacterium]
MANIFPRSSNWLPLKIVLMALVLGTGVSAGMWYYFTPKYTRVGYQPVQPVQFSHKIHAGQLGMDCRYCHSFVEVAAHSNIPTTQVCMNCHAQVQPQNPKLAPVRESWQTGKPIAWTQVHKSPDYVYFNHAAHVNRGVSCVSCHGDVSEMEVVHHEKSHSMDFCLTCHRNPENELRPLAEVTNLKWQATPNEGESVSEAQVRIGTELKKAWNINPPDKNCAGCHR